jgi:hypothetical protein
MSATIIGPAVIENVRSIDPTPRCLEFDAQLWLALSHIITAKLCYYNYAWIDFLAVNYCLIVAHVRLLSLSLLSLTALR